MPAGSDASYMKAAKKGDTKGAQLLVNAASRKAGYKIKAYHWTENEFNVFDTDPNWQLGAHFGTKDAASSRRSKVVSGRGGDPKIHREAGKIIPVRLKLNNMLRLSDPGSWSLTISMWKDTLKKQGIDTSGLKEIPRADQPEPKGRIERDGSWGGIYMNRNARFEGGEAVTTPEAVRRLLKGLGYDGIVYKNAVEFSGKFKSMSDLKDSYIVFDPENVKSNAPYTLDSNANIIPLSERFNPSSDDIRYMPAVEKGGKVKRKGSATSRKSSARIPMGAVAKQLRLERDLKKKKRN